MRAWVKPIWVAPEGLEEQRCLVRTRRFLVQQKTRVANRLRGYAKQVGVELKTSEVGSRRNRERLLSAPWTKPRRQSVEARLRQLEQLEQELEVIEKQLEELYKTNEYAQLLTTLPKCNKGLALTIALQIGDIGRFRSAEALRSYAGLAPQVKESAGRRQRGGNGEAGQQASEVGFHATGSLPGAVESRGQPADERVLADTVEADGPSLRRLSGTGLPSQPVV